MGGLLVILFQRLTGPVAADGGTVVRPGTLRPQRAEPRTVGHSALNSQDTS